MKKLLLFLYLVLVNYVAIGQQVSAAVNITELSYAAKQKFDGYMARKSFAFIGTDYKGDTIQRNFEYKFVKGKGPDSIPVERSVTSLSTKEDFSFIYRTASTNEFRKIRDDIKKEGFFCNQEKDSLTAPVLMYQHNDVTVCISSKTIDTLTEYSFLVRKQELPKPKEISFAEDLAVFNSHECLRFYFGEQNVKKDIYYLSEGRVGKCSVIFANTNRQVVFLWSDAVNNFGLAKIYIGGQLMAETNLQYENNIPENLWRLKSGVRPGMSLYQLRKLNDAAFNFNGGNSKNSLMIATDSTGKLDFKNESIILGCMNCTDPAFLRKTVINSDDAIQDERILFVNTIILAPRVKPVVEKMVAR